MILDMHMHIWPSSTDSHMTLKEAVEQGKKLGLDGICVTDHDNLDIKEKALKYSREINFPIFVGVEILSYEGDVVVFGLDEVPKKMLHVEELLDLVEEKGGVAIVAHPFRKNNRGLGNKIEDVYERLSGVEVLNGNTTLDLNEAANELSLKLGIGRVGASDAHHKHEVGRYATKFKRKITSVDELIKEIKNGGFEPVTYLDGKYHENPENNLIGNKYAGIIMGKGA